MSSGRSASGSARASPGTENSAFGSWREWVYGMHWVGADGIGVDGVNCSPLLEKFPQRARSDPRPAVALVTAAARIQRQNAATASPDSSLPPPPKTHTDPSLQLRVDTLKFPDIIAKFWRFVTHDSGLHDCHTW